MSTRRTRRAGRNRPSMKPEPTPERRLPDGVRPSPFPGGGYVWECACGVGSWRPTVEELTGAIGTHARRRHPQAEAA